MKLYVGICNEIGNRIAEQFALGYALNRILTVDAEQQEFIDWYFSGNWVIQQQEEQAYEI